MMGNLIRGAVAAAVLAMTAATGWAGDFTAPVQKIIGVEKPISIGDVVELSVSPVGEPPQFYVGSKYVWRIEGRDGTLVKITKECRDGSILFGTGKVSTTLRVYCSVSHLFIHKDGDAVVETASVPALLYAQVKIGDGVDPVPPGPGPGPGPGPDPDPVFPDGQYKLSKFVYDAVVAKVPAGENRSASAKALATSFRGIAAAIAAGTLKDGKAILTETAKANNTALAKLGTKDWEAFSDVLQDKLFGLYQGGDMKTPDDFRAAWGELAAGLEKVK